jgi:hypothetical protein
MTDRTSANRPVLLWGNKRLINLADKAVKSACKHPLLHGRKLIARGAYSLIFERGDSVFKLTVDRVAYELAEQQSKWCCRGLPTTRRLHGEMGMTASGTRLRLIELERLERLDRGSEIRKACLSISRLVMTNRHECKTPAEQLRDIQPQVTNNILCEAVALL